MLDFNSFQWSARKCDADADACNPFSLLYSVPFVCMYEWWRKWFVRVMHACVSAYKYYVALLRMYGTTMSIDVSMCVWIIRARYGVLLESQCQCQWSCEQTKSNQNNIHFLYGENNKKRVLRDGLRMREYVYTYLYILHTHKYMCVYISVKIDNNKASITIKFNIRQSKISIRGHRGK